jgi:hypothetical protein
MSARRRVGVRHETARTRRQAFGTAGQHLAGLATRSVNGGFAASDSSESSSRK